MAATYDELMGLRSDGLVTRYSARDTMLYALSIGMGRDPLDRDELPFVYERPALRAMPSMASVLFASRLLHDCGLDYSSFVHGEQRIRFERPLPAQGELRADTRVIAVYDKGPGRGAVVVQEGRVTDASTGDLLYVTTQSTFARADGGLGGPLLKAPVPHAVPQRPADHVVQSRTDPNQALWYRLNGDFNPLHADPDAARRAGFEAPILHGLCTYGIACRAILKAVCDLDPVRMATLDVRFSAPVLPGETIATDLWDDGNVVSFVCRSVERGIVVINNGKCTLRIP